VKAFLDTSVLVAAFYGDHEHHGPSLALLAGQNRSTGLTAAHCLAEVYSVLTGMPGKDRVSPHEALLFLGDVRERLVTITLDETEYFAVLESAASSGVAGGSTYDAIIAQCALKADAQTLFTWNVRHFKRFGEQISARVREPDPQGYTVQERHYDPT
jgi:predicted nucleic acid-binding protein